MNDKMKKALLESFEIKKSAKIAQSQRGHSDQGERAGITSGKHLDPIVNIIAEEIISAGIEEKDVHASHSGMELPGWFRPTKQWDILAFSQDALVMAIELKSISSSYSKNLNNRVEEALGMAVDVKSAERHGLFQCNIPPLFAYVMIVKSDDQSRKQTVDPKDTYFKADDSFYGCSYIERFKIMCRRFVEEGMYDAVWFVTVDPESGVIDDPDPSLNYDNFLSKIKNQIAMFDIFEERAEEY